MILRGFIASCVARTIALSIEISWIFPIVNLKEHIIAYIYIYIMQYGSFKE